MPPARGPGVASTLGKANGSCHTLDQSKPGNEESIRRLCVGDPTDAWGGRARLLLLPFLRGVQFFFQWGGDNPLALFHFLGQRVLHYIWSDHICVSGQVVQDGFNGRCWCVEIHQEIPRTDRTFQGSILLAYPCSTEQAAGMPMNPP